MSHPASRFAKALPAILVGVFLVVLSVGAFENLNTVGDGTGGGGGSLSVETQTLQNVTSLGASTTFGITADYFVSTGLATSTLAGGLRITTGGLRVSTMASCDTIDTDSDGDLICGTDNTGAGGVTFPLSQSVTFSANNSWDLATATNSARNVYASGTVFASTLNAGIINSSNNTLLQINLNGAPSYGFSDTYFRPWNNNTVDLGTFDAAWAGFFSSGTAYLTTTNNAGTLTTGQLSVTGAATSTFTPGVSALGLSAGYLTLTGFGTSTVGDVLADDLSVSRLSVTGAASTTIAGGLRVTGGLLRVTGLANCNTVDTDSNGQLACGTDADSGGFGGHSAFNIFPTTNNTFSLGFATSSWKNIYASSTAFLGGVITSGSILPTVNNLIDLGSPTSSFRNIYASGTAFLGTLTVTGSATTSFVGGVSALGLSGGYLTLTGTGSSTIAGNLNLTGGVAAANLTLTGANTSTLKLITTTGLASTGGITVTGGSILNTSSATSTWTGGLSVGAGGLLTSSGLTITGGSVLNTSAVTSTFTGGFSALGLSGGYLTLTGLGTSTFVGNLSLNNLATARLAVTGSSSSTIASGLIISNGGLRVAGLLSCDTVDTDSTGKLVCGTDGGGAGASFGGDAAFNVYPTTNNARDLGFPTSSWKDIYASGTVFLGGTAPITLGNPAGAQVLLPGNAGINALTFDTNGALTGGNLFNFEVNNSQIAALTAAGRFNVNNQDGGIGFQISGTSPQWMLLESDGPTNEKYWSSYAEAGVLYFRTLSDGLSATTDYLRVTRDDISISRLEYPIGGNVSYGTIAANGKLAVAAAGVATTTLFLQTPTATPSRSPAIEFSATGSLRATPSVDNGGHSAFSFDTTAAVAGARIFSISENGTLRMSIDHQGFMGVGTSTPRSPLHVTSPTANATSTLWVGTLGSQPGQICMVDTGTTASGTCFFSRAGSLFGYSTSTY